MRVRKRSQLELAFIVFSNLGYHFSGALNDDRTLEMGGFERKEPGGGGRRREKGSRCKTGLNSMFSAFLALACVWLANARRGA